MMQRYRNGTVVAVFNSVTFLAALPVGTRLAIDESDALIYKRERRDI